MREPFQLFFPTFEAGEIFYKFLGDIATMSFDIPENGRSLVLRDVI